MALADAPFTELLDAIAARTPAPGGGAVAALAGATAAALTEMAAAFAEARSADQNAAAIRERAATLRVRLLGLADEDAAVYHAVLEATDPDGRKRALSAAADPPLEIATAAAEIAELASAIATSPGNEQLLGDATAAATVAEAAAQAAARLVELNLARQPGDLRLSEVHELTERAAGARAATLKLTP